MFFNKKCNRWVAIGQSNIGKSHIDSNIPCQDNVYYVCNKNGIYCALCDGLGSKSKSDLGSSYISQKIVNILQCNFDNLYLYSEDDLSKYIINSLKNEAMKDLKASEKELDNYKTTLVFLAIKKGKYILGSIGDSIVGLLKNDSIYYISNMSKNNEDLVYANTTFSVFDNDAINNLSIKKGTIEDKFNSAFLISDGLPFLAHSNKVAPKLVQFINMLENTEFEYISNLMNKTLKSIVDSKSNCVDDWSYIFVKKVKTEFNAKTYYDSKRVKR